MSPGPSRTAPPGALGGSVTLVVGPEELLADRAVDKIVSAARDAHRDLNLHDLEASVLEPGQFGDLISPSLFGGETLVVLRGVERIGAADSEDDSDDSDDEIGAVAASGVVAELTAYVREPDADVRLVLVHRGLARGRGILNAAKKAGAIEIQCKAVPKRGRARVDFATEEIQGAGRTVSREAATALVEATGEDLRALAAACAQLVADVDGSINVTHVRRYFGGNANVQGFDISDAVFDGRITEALERVRLAMDSGTHPLPIVGALASTVRSLAVVMAAPPGWRASDFQRELGIPEWKLSRVQQQARRWSQRSLADAVTVLAKCDADIKGQAADPAYALERAVVKLAALPAA
jgi:DNA polymerase III subunit delta